MNCALGSRARFLIVKTASAFSITKHSMFDRALPDPIVQALDFTFR
jgi:hypothetical protein